MVEQPTEQFPRLCAGDYCVHPRLGEGRVLCQRPDGRVVVHFVGKDKPDTLYPFALQPAQPRKAEGR